jgi:hypothetical protein
MHRINKYGQLYSKIKSTLSFLILIGILILPSHVESWFNGLPWSNKPELIIIVIIIPFLVLLGRSFLSYNWGAIGLGALLALKMGLAIYAPPSGWGLSVYATPEDMAKDQWERTYESIWKGDFSDILERPLKTKRDFPIEWLNRYNSQSKRQVGLWVKVNGFASIPLGARLAIITKGATMGQWEVFEDVKSPRKMSLVGSLDQVDFSDISVWPEGRVKIQGQVFYSGEDWSLDPILLYPDGRTEPATKKGVLWQTSNGLEPLTKSHSLYKIMAQIVDFGLLGFFGFWGFWLIRHLWQEKFITSFLVCLILGSIALPWLGKGVALIQIIFIGWSFLHKDLWEKWKENPGLLNLIIIGPFILSFFARRWWPEIGQMTFFSIGDDWTDYQNLARDIVVKGDFWQTSYPIFVHQPLYRYFVGFLHLLFGQSVVAQQFLDVWSVLGASCILVSLAVKFGLTLPFASGTSFLYLIPTFGGDFRHSIGRGLQEPVAMLFMMLALWAAAQYNEGRVRQALLAGLFAAIGFWLRMDHFGVLAGTAFLVFDFTSESTKKNWISFIKEILSYKLWLFLFFSILLLAFFMIPFRNWIFSGHFAINTPSNINFLLSHSWLTGFNSFRLLLLASEGPAAWTSFILIPGTVIGLLALIWRGGPLVDYPLSLGILLIGLLAPYLLVKVNAYTPRFSIHLLPIATLSLVVFTYNSWRYLKSKYYSPGK